MELYYGLPNEIWDALYLEAEDLLQEEELGQHLVGVYPAGGRIYGIESYPPGLMCLYMDVVESLIDPTSSYHKESGFKVFKVMNGNSPLYMVDLFKWVRWITTDQTNDWRMEEFLHIIPFGGQIIYEDDSISSIIGSVREFMIKQNFKLCGDGPIRHSSKTLAYPFARAYHSLMQTGKFRPCLNSNWDQVIDIDTDRESGLLSLDREVIRAVSTSDSLPEIDPKNVEVFPCWKMTDSKMISLIKKQTIDLYRYQL